MKLLFSRVPAPAFSVSSLTDVVVRSLQAPRSRRWFYGRLAVLFFIAAIVVALGKSVKQHRSFDLVVSDGRWYYAYLPTLINDGDLDFTNQITEHWGPDFQPVFLDQRTPLGVVHNKYPIGMALTLLPAYLAAQAISLLLADSIGSSWLAADGYNPIYQVICLAWIIFLGWHSYCFIDRLLVKFFQISGRVVGYSVILYWVGTGYCYYFFREPFMVHVVSTFWVTGSILLIAELRQQMRQGQFDGPRLVSLVFALSMAIVCRPSNLFLTPFVALLAYEILRAKMLGRVFRHLPVLAFGLTPLALQMLVWHELSGQWLFYSYSGERFDWTEPAVWQTLLSSRHGLFFWSPILFLAAVGTGYRLFARPTKPGQSLLVCYVLSFLILWYLNSAWQTWWFGDAFGARSFLELSSLFVLGLASFAEQIHDTAPRGSRRPILAGIGMAAIAFNICLMTLYITHRIPRGEGLIAGF